MVDAGIDPGVEATWEVAGPGASARGVGGGPAMGPVKDLNLPAAMEPRGFRGLSTPPSDPDGNAPSLHSSVRNATRVAEDIIYSWKE